jgi:CheY-like chemotaxis protein
MEPSEVVTTLQRAGGFMNRILVIDDDQAIQKALKRLFEATLTAVDPVTGVSVTFPDLSSADGVAR